jgi:hypothetical protein
MRAKQLKRGALLRLEDDAESVRNRPFKCERAGDGRSETRPGPVRGPADHTVG